MKRLRNFDPDALWPIVLTLIMIGIVFIVAALRVR